MKFLRLVLVFCLLSTTGVQWVALQGFAWAKMTIERVDDRGVFAAIKTAIIGDPCSMCMTARRGSADSQKNQLKFNYKQVEMCLPVAVVIIYKKTQSWKISFPNAIELEGVLSVEIPPPLNLA